MNERFRKALFVLLLDRPAVIWCFFLLAFTGVLIYRNAFSAPFIFDDVTQILLNPKIQTLQWPWTFLENNRRPVLYTSLAFDFHQFGSNAFGYHAFNIRIHILAAMFLFLLIYKTCRYPSMNPNIRRDAAWLALGASLLWLSHPIQTQAVTYIIQRAESLMGLFFFMSLFFSAQYLTSRQKGWWVASIISGLLCGLTKEVALALPLIVLMYDYAFVSPSLREALQKNRWLYLGLGLIWPVMIFLYLTTRPEEKLTAGFGMEGMTPWIYALNQPTVIMHYFRLLFFPHPLVFDYDMRPDASWWELLPSILIVFAIVLSLFAVFKRNKTFGFLGLAFFVILAPSSSIIPVKDLIFEYRVYLSAATVTTGFVLIFYFLLERYVQVKKRKVVFICVLAILTTVLGGLTFQRNKVYASEEALWKDIIQKWPSNARSYNNLAEIQFRKKQLDLAKKNFLKSIEMNGNRAEVYANVAVIMAEEKDFENAIGYAQRAIAIDPKCGVCYTNYGSVLSRQGRYQESIPYFQKSLDLGFEEPGVLHNFGIALAQTGQLREAVPVLEKALSLDPEAKNIRQTLKAVRKQIK